MKINYMIIAVSMLFICLFNNFYLRVIVAFIICCSYKLFCGKERLIYRLILIILLFLSLPIKADYFTYGYVENIKDKYIIVNNGLYRVIVYTDNNEFEYGDKLIINDEIKPINSYNNFEITDFSSYCKGNNILGYVDSNNIEIDKKFFSVKNLLYKRNMKNNNYWANSFLFSRNISIESDNLYLISQSGMQLSFLFSKLRKILNRFFYKRKTLFITFILSIILSFIMGIDFAIIRIIISLLSEILYDDRRKKVAFEIILLCFIKPYYILSLPFLIPIGLKLIHLFANKKSKIFDIIYICTIQLMFYHYCNIIQIICFSLIRYISASFYFLSLIAFIPLNLNKFVIKYINFIDKISLIKFNGRIFILFLIIIIYCFFYYMITGYKKYVYILLIILILNNFSAFFRPYYTITFLDIGQGDCCLITVPFSNEGLLIDTGGSKYKDVGNELLIPYLKRLNINQVDVIITHLDYDHYGALEQLEQNFRVNRVYYDKKYEIDFHNLKIYNPLYSYQYDNENDNSQISYIRLKQFYFLFLADVGIKPEYDLVNEYGQLKVDVVKLSHHGSKTATTEKMLAAYRIDTAVISAGRGNRYGHPNNEVVERLKNYQVNILSTKDNHAIKFYIFNHLMIAVSADMHFRIYLK